MKCSHLYTVYFLLLFTVSPPIVAQSLGSGTRIDKDFSAIVKGQIIDIESNSPLEYATISLFTEQDSSLVTGGITNEKGIFGIKAPFGHFFAKIEFLSFETQFIEHVSLSPEKLEEDLGVIRLSVNDQLLSDIEVTAEKSHIQLLLDKKIFHVGKDITSAGGSAVEVLENVPSVTVDVQGNVSLRGNQKVRILVDGKPSGLISMNGDGGLRQLPADLIAKVEVITNPSARYEAEGVAGIINIVLKKKRKKGLNGSFSALTGTLGNYGITATLNYREKKVNLFGNFGFRYSKRPGNGTLFQELYNEDGTTAFLDQAYDYERNGYSKNFRLGADYFLNAKNTLTASFAYRGSDENQLVNRSYGDYWEVFPDNLTSSVDRIEDQKDEGTTVEYGLDYKRTFAKKRQKLTANFQYRNNSGTEASRFRDTYFVPAFSPGNRFSTNQRSNKIEGAKSVLASIAYVYPIGEEGKLEVGYRGSFRDLDNDYFVEDLRDFGLWFPLKEYINTFGYNEEIHAAYIIFGNKHNKFSYQLGMRGEDSEITTELVQTEETNKRSYSNLFPSVHLSYDLPNRNALQISYSRRLYRPRFRDLNPFFIPSDARNFRSGNPDLNPEFTDSYEVSQVKYWDNTSFGSSIYYRHTTGKIQQIRRLTSNGNSISRPENLLEENTFGLELNFSTSLTGWWKLNGDFNFFRELIDAGYLGELFGSETHTATFRLTSRMTMWKKLKLQLRGSYDAPRNTPQGNRKSIAALDIGVSADLLEDKASLVLSVGDVFNSRFRRYSTFGENFYGEGQLRWQVRQANLTFVYRLKKKK